MENFLLSLPPDIELLEPSISYNLNTDIETEISLRKLL